MAEIFHQLGELVLGSVPTMVLFVLLIAAYNALVKAPLEQTLTERRQRTTVAVEQARGALLAAEAETSVYEDKLSAAKVEMFAAREQRLQRFGVDRESLLNEARLAMQQKVRDARREIDDGASIAQGQIELVSHELSSKILRAILPVGASVPGITE